MPPPGQSGQRRHYILTLSFVLPSVSNNYVTTIILMQNDADGLRSKGMKRSPFGVRKSKLKLIRRRNMSQIEIYSTEGVENDSSGVT